MHIGDMTDVYTHITPEGMQCLREGVCISVTTQPELCWSIYICCILHFAWFMDHKRTSARSGGYGKLHHCMFSETLHFNLLDSITLLCCSFKEYCQERLRFKTPTNVMHMYGLLAHLIIP